MKNNYQCLFICLLTLLLSAPALYADKKFGSYKHHQIRYGGFGIKVGILNTGKITATEKSTAIKTEYDPKPGMSFGFFFEFPLFYGVMISPAFDWHHIRIYDLSKTSIDISLALKPYIYKPESGIAIKLSAAAGFGYLADWEVLDATSYLTLKSYVELVLFTRSRQAWLVELGYMAAPVGGNSNTDITLNPSLFLRVGLMY